MKIKILSLFFSVAFFNAVAQNNYKFKGNKQLKEGLNKYFTDASAQYKLLAKNLTAGKFPKTYFSALDKYEFSNSDWWCSGFYPGTLFLLYAQTKDTLLNNEALRILELLKKEQYNTSTHDLGFMMYCSFGNAYLLEPKQEYKNILLQSAKSLSSRFNSNVGCIKSWNGKDKEYLVIIDNMMNLKLLFWATQATGDSSFFKIAVAHANTTLKNHFRNDYSSYHVLNYNASTGIVQQKKTAQGVANESAWSRGQAWGLYGFTETYRETKDAKYLDQANKIANFILSHPNFPADKIPYWDFNAPTIPNALRDASAAAINASALLELCTFTDKKNAKRYFKAAEIMLNSLSSNIYKATEGANGGFIIKHCVGHMPNITEIDVPLSYADYYFIEALVRYKNIITK